MWVVLALVLGLAVTAASWIISRRRSRRADSAAPEIPGEDMFNLGVIFTSAGVALMASLGPFMMGLTVLGIAYMVLGARAKRHQSGG